MCGQLCCADQLQGKVNMSVSRSKPGNPSPRQKTPKNATKLTFPCSKEAHVEHMKKRIKVLFGYASHAWLSSVNIILVSDIA